jgi:hypothetical protein
MTKFEEGRSRKVGQGCQEIDLPIDSKPSTTFLELRYSKCKHKSKHKPKHKSNQSIKSRHNINTLN